MTRLASLFSTCPRQYFSGPLLALSSILLPFFAQQIARAQTIHFSERDTVVAAGFNTPLDVAVDAAGNLYVADAPTNQVLKIPVGGGAQTSVGTGLEYPEGVAVDALGNLFIADSANNRIIKVPAGGGLQSVVISGLNSPEGVAVDAAGNIVIANTGGNNIVKISAGSGLLSYFNGFNLPEKVAIDSAGNIYVADTGNGRIVKIAGAGGAQTTVGSSLGQPDGVAVDDRGNVYVSEYTSNRVGKFAAGASSELVGLTQVIHPAGLVIDPAGNIYVADIGDHRVVKVETQAVNFGNVNICPAGCSVTASLSYFRDVFFLMPKVVTDGAPNLDFTLAAGGDCGSVTSFYCTVNVTFTLKYAGLRRGAVQVFDNQGNLLATTPIYGVGSGPEIAFGPGVQSVIPTGALSLPLAVAVDAAGTIFTADRGNNRVVKVVPGGSPVYLGTGLLHPDGVAINGAGDVFIADTDNNRVVKVPAAGGPQTNLITGLNEPIGLAVNGAGDVFIADALNNRVLKAPADGSAPIPIGSGLQNPATVAVDASGNVFIADPGNHRIVEVPIAGGPQIVIASGFGNPTGVAVDAAGDVFVADAGVTRIIELPAGGGPPVNIGNGFSLPHAVALDATGNLFVADSGATRIVEIVRSTPPTLDFPSTAVGNASSPQSVIPQNIGNAPLMLTASTLGSTFSTTTGSGTPADCTSGILLLPGVGCNISVSFVPDLPGQRSGIILLRDDSLDGGLPFASSQSISLKGIGTEATQIITFGPIASQNLGTTLTLSASASSGLPVTFTSTTPAVCTIANSNVVSLIAAGTCTIIASQGGNTIYPAAPPVFQSFSVVGGTPFISGQTLGPLRNNYTGLVGFQFTVGATPVQVYSVGRFVAPGNTGTHLLKLVQSNGFDVPNGSAMVSTQGATVGQYRYALLGAGITLLANTSYYLVSQETAGGDQWYDYGFVNPTSVATVVGPTYTDFAGKYVTVTVLPGQAYVPLSFLYTPPTTTLSATITSPAAGGTISGNAPIAVTTTGPVTSLQVQIDGVNQGGPVPVSVNQGPPFTVNLDTTVLKNGSHALTVVASDAQSNLVTSSPVSITINNSPGGSTAFVLGQSLGALRNNYSGFVGFTLTTGSTPVVVTTLGRFVAPQNSGTHLLKLVAGNGVDLPGGSVSISLNGATAGTYRYSVLPAGPLTLQANTTYYLVSQEIAGGDQWYDYGPISISAVATVVGPAYSNQTNNYVTVGNLAGNSYVPLSFLYGPTANTLSATITSPQPGALLSGNNVQVTVSTTGTITSLQLQVDGTNTGSPVASGPLTLDTTKLTNGPHTLTVLIAEGNAATAVSPAVSVSINNGGTIPNSFITSQVPSNVRNDYTGFVGMAINVGSTPLSVTSLGRLFVSGNSSTHALKLVQANGTDVPGGSVTLSSAGGTPGQFTYATLLSPVALLANTTYYLVSQETAGGDQWYNLEPVTPTVVAQVAGPTYVDGQGHYVTVGGFPNYSYVPVSFQYQ